MSKELQEQPGSASLLAVTALSFWKTQIVAGVQKQSAKFREVKVAPFTCKDTHSPAHSPSPEDTEFPNTEQEILKMPCSFLFFWLYKQKGDRVITTRPSAGRSPSISPQGQVCCRISSGEGHTKVSEMIWDGFAEGFAQASHTGSDVWGAIDGFAVGSARKEIYTIYTKGLRYNSLVRFSWVVQTFKAIQTI